MKNIVFQDKNQNSIKLEIGISTPDRGTLYYNLLLLYSQPDRLFRLPSRINFELGGVVGWDKYNAFTIGISEDILLPIASIPYGNLYIGAGLGFYIRNISDDRIGSNFTFGERLFLGYSHKNSLFEIYIKHYSNGTIQLPNGGHNFLGVSLGYTF